MSPAEQLRQHLGLEHDPAGDAFGFPWSSWSRVVRSAPKCDPDAETPARRAARVVEASRTVRLPVVDPRQMELAV